jgi:hypothetical protein
MILNFIVADCFLTMSTLMLGVSLAHMGIHIMYIDRLFTLWARLDVFGAIANMTTYDSLGQ